MFCRCSDQDLLNTRMSSKKTRTNFQMKGHKTSFIRDWNVDGPLGNPKGITKNLKWSRCMRNVVLSMSYGCMHTK
jgi:hypothetical protein